MSYLTDHVLDMPGMCEGWSLTTSMVMGSLFRGKFHIQVLQQEENNLKKYTFQVSFTLSL